MADRQSSIAGFESVYRSPFKDKGRWVVRRRDLTKRGPGAVRRIALKIDPKARWSKAWAEVCRMAVEERAAGKAPPEKATLMEVIEAYLKAVEARAVTVKKAEYDLKRAARLLGEHRIFRDLEIRDLDSLFDEHWRDLAARTKILRRRRLVALWSWATKRRYCARNVAEDLEVKAAWRREAKIAAAKTGVALDEGQARRLLAASLEGWEINFTPKAKRAEDNARTPHAPDDSLWLFLVISLFTGLRVSNVTGTKHKRGLSWGDVNLEARTFTIDGPRMKNGIDLGPLPLHDQLAEVLRARLRALGRIPEAEEPIVPVAPEWCFTHRWRSVLRRAELGAHVRVHDLRSSYATWLGNAAPLPIVKVLLGHSRRGDVTMGYQHPPIQTMREWLNRAVPRLLDPVRAEGGAPSPMISLDGA